MTDAAIRSRRKTRAFSPAGREKAFARARRHSRLVRLLKVVLPAAAVVVAGIFVGYSMLSSAGVARVEAGLPAIEDGKLVMSNPKLDGFTNNNLPYEMTAARATQALGGASAIHLEKIRGKVPMDAGTEVSFEAASGTFDREGNTLDINSPLALTTTSGIRAWLQSALINIDTNELSTDKAVEVDMNGMHITADSLHTTKGGRVFMFDRRVRVRIDPSTLKQTPNSGKTQTHE